MFINYHHHSFIHCRCKPAESVCLHQHGHIRVAGCFSRSENQYNLPVLDKFQVLQGSTCIQRSDHTRRPLQEGNHKERSDAERNGVLPIFADSYSHLPREGREFLVASMQGNPMAIMMKLHIAICLADSGKILSIFDRSARAPVTNSCRRHYFQFKFVPAVGSAHEGAPLYGVLSLCYHPRKKKSGSADRTATSSSILQAVPQVMQDRRSRRHIPPSPYPSVELRTFPDQWKWCV